MRITAFAMLRPLLTIEFSWARFDDEAGVLLALVVVVAAGAAVGAVVVVVGRVAVATGGFGSCSVGRLVAACSR